MFNEEKFQFNIENIKNDLAIEGMDITENDVNMYRIKKLSKFLNLIDNFLII